MEEQTKTLKYFRVTTKLQNDCPDVARCLLDQLYHMGYTIFYDGISPYANTLFLFHIDCENPDTNWNQRFPGYGTLVGYSESMQSWFIVRNNQLVELP